MIDTILFDLDGTLLEMDEVKFTNEYLAALVKAGKQAGYEGKVIYQAIVSGLKALSINDGKISNEQAFWQAFENVSGIKQKQIEQVFIDFYENDFDEIIASSCRPNPNAVIMINELKTKKYHLILATNPLFPRIATNKRIAFAKLNKDDFDLITTYEDFYTTKPDLAYYQSIFAKCHLKTSQVMMIGNSVSEDYVLNTLDNIPVYLIDTCLSNPNKLFLSADIVKSSDEMMEFIKALPKLL